MPIPGSRIAIPAARSPPVTRHLLTEIDAALAKAVPQTVLGTPSERSNTDKSKEDGDA
jgi:hypothetical protein